jgi:hypothetical protein
VPIEASDDIFVPTSDEKKFNQCIEAMILNSQSKKRDRSEIDSFLFNQSGQNKFKLKVNKFAKKPV